MRKTLAVVFVVFIGSALALPAQNLTITAPNGGETLTLGQTVQITWTANNVSQKVKLQLIRGGGALVGLIAGNLSASPSSFAWTVGQTDAGTATADTNYKIRIRSADNAIEDASNAAFTLAAASTPPPPPPGSFSSPYQRKTPEMTKNPGPDFSLPASALFTSCTVNGVSAETSWNSPITCREATDIVIQAHASSAVQPVLYHYRLYLVENPGNIQRLILEQAWTEQNRLVINITRTLVLTLLYPNGVLGTIPQYATGTIFVEAKNSTQSEPTKNKEFKIRWYF